MTEKEIKVQMLRIEAKRLGLDAPESFWLAPVSELAEIYNGCGPERMSKFGRRGLTFAMREFEPAVLIHDYRFEFSDGSKKLFHIANNEFYANCRKLAAESFRMVIRAGGLLLSPVIYVKCQVKALAGWLMLATCGWSAWTDAYNLRLQGEV